MEKKSNKGIVIALCTVIIVLIATITYLFVSGTVAFNVKENKEDKNKTEEKFENNKEENKEEEKEEDNSPKQLSLDDPLVQKLYGYVSVNDFENVIQDVLSKYGTVTNKTINDNIKLMMALHSDKTLVKQFTYVETKNTECGAFKAYNLNSSIITNKINEMFGKDNGYGHSRVGTVFSKDEIGMSSDVGCVYIDYVASSDVYEMTEMCGCGGMTDHKIYSKLVNAEKINDTIVLTQKGYVHYGSIYPTTDYRDAIATNVDFNSVANNEEYFEKGATTKYTFKQSEDGSYYFESKITN